MSLAFIGWILISVVLFTISTFVTGVAGTKESYWGTTIGSAFMCISVGIFLVAVAYGGLMLIGVI